ncbi:MAG: hypothetical protein A3J24_06770 [Deltaproteobacteria bacterium RIFCSPLOWO2_02_FULL_53_8]|nr:MAG: hypothetical protein A3J24_06770 [Deltaproteobacteria bacterium RIFCSPLOWO2_02_FULL_53_8]
MRLLRKITAPAGWKIGLLATIIGLLTYTFPNRFFDMIELKAYDLHFYSRGVVAPGSEVVIAAIDEKSLNAYGRWPWSRSRMAELLNSLKKSGAAVVAFDIVFPHEDESSGISAIRRLKERFRTDKRLLPTLKDLEKQADNDANLASALSDNENAILGYYFYFEDGARMTNGKKEGYGYFTSSAFNIVRPIDGSDGEAAYTRAAGANENLPVIAEAALNFGFFNIVPDIEDGVVRRVPLAIEYDGSVYPHISLSTVRAYMGGPPLIINTAAYGVDSIQIEDLKIPTDERGHMTINYRGPDKTFPHYSIADIVNGTVPAKNLKGKIVLVGATAVGIYDMRSTPYSPTFPGVEVHANIIDNILHSDYISRPDWVWAFDFLIILVTGIVLSIAIPRMRPLYATLLTAAVGLVFIFINDLIFNHWRIWVAEVYPVLSMLLVSATVTTFQFMTEEKRRREIKSAFSQYVSPTLVNQLMKNPKLLALGGEERRLTVIFSDIRGFTTLSEGLKPDALVKLINDYLTPMTDLIMKNDGTIDKYMGDAIMAFWNAPLDQPEHPKMACRTALEMLKKLDELSPVWEAAGIKKFDIGIGISTGRAIVGNMGSNQRFDYTVMGDTINLGSRLEGLNKEYGTHIIVPKFTYLDVKAEFVLRELDYVRVKGKDQPIQIFELMGYKTNTIHQRVANLFEQGLAAYRQQLWTMADKFFNDALALAQNDGPSKIFIARIAALREDEKLPRDWDGVFIMTKK